MAEAPGIESALPSTGARVLAVASIVVAGICGGLIGWKVTTLQVHDAGALADGPRPFEQADHRLGNGVVVHGNDGIDVTGNDLSRQYTRRLDLDAVGDRVRRRGDLFQNAIDEKATERRDRFGLHADDAHVRSLQLDRQRDARDQTATAERDDDQTGSRQLREDLEKKLRSRDQWDVPLLRALFDELLKGVGKRRRSVMHERVWFNLAGFCLRPGFGYPLDDWRIEQIWPLFAQGLQFPQENQSWAEWWTFWRRAAGSCRSR